MWKDKLKQEWNDNPMQVIAVGAMATTAVVAVLNAMSQARSRNAYARQVNYRVNR